MIRIFYIIVTFGAYITYEYARKPCYSTPTFSNFFKYHQLNSNIISSCFFGNLSINAFKALPMQLQFTRWSHSIQRKNPANIHIDTNP